MEDCKVVIAKTQQGFDVAKFKLNTFTNQVTLLEEQIWILMQVLNFFVDSMFILIELGVLMLNFLFKFAFCVRLNVKGLIKKQKNLNCLFTNSN